MGVEKIALGSVAIENPIIISEIAEIVGNQESIVAVIDIKKRDFQRIMIYLRLMQKINRI